MIGRVRWHGGQAPCGAATGTALRGRAGLRVVPGGCDARSAACVVLLDLLMLLHLRDAEVECHPSSTRAEARWRRMVFFW